MATIQALLFDVFGTVVDWRSGVAAAIDRFCRDQGIAGQSGAALADAWRARYQPAMAAVREGRRPFTRLDTLHRENLDLVLADAGIDLSAVPPGALDDLNLAWHRLDPWPDSRRGLARLRQRFLIAPLSNGNIALLTHMAKRAGLPWDCILGAEVAQAYKPMPEAYLRTADILGLAPGDCMMVAAHNSDLAAAQRAGLATAFLPRPTEHGPGQRSDLAAEGDWTVVATDLEDLATRLGCPPG